jgi:hypothetical protein
VSRLAVAAAVVAAVGLSACMEVEQASTTSAKPVGQTVKRDTKPYDSTPLAYESSIKWSKGDKASWENQIRTRQFAQHEHKRIYQ